MFDLWSKWEGFCVILTARNSVLIGQWVIFNLLILRERRPTLDKNPLRRFVVWTHEKNQWFCTIVITDITDWVDHFQSLAGATPM